MRAVESLCYQIHLVREQFMWPIVEDHIFVIAVAAGLLFLLCVSVFLHE